MKTWAIVVGINEYPPAANQRLLKGAVADACDFAEWALEPEGGNVAPDRLLFWVYPWAGLPTTGLLHNYLQQQLLAKWDDIDLGWSEPDQNRAPKAEHIIRTVEIIGRNAYKAARDSGDNEHRRILVFLAGHGVRTTANGDTTQQTCFVTRDFRPADGTATGGLVPCLSLRRSLRNRRFDEVLFFLDCCREDLPYTNVRAFQCCDLHNDREEPGWSVGHAAQDQKRAYETENSPYRGAFSKTLMEGLRKHRDPATNALTVSSLDQYVTANICKATNKDQHPYFDFLPKDEPITIVTGGAVVDGNATPGPMVHLHDVPIGTRLILLDGFGNLVTGVPPLVVTGPTLTLPLLPESLYEIRIEGDPERYTIFKHPKQREIHVR